MPTIFSPDELSARFKGKKVSSTYVEAVNLYERIRVHADGEMPINIIKKARPNESDAIMEYRVSIYESETQNPVERVFGMLEKIRRSPDWMIRFDNEVPAIINKEETLKEYISKKYPIYGDIEDWLFEEGIRAAGLDANAVVVVMPVDLSITPGRYMEPIAQIFYSPNVIDFASEDFAFVSSGQFSSLLTPDEQMQRSYLPVATGLAKPSQVYYLIDTTSYQKWEETKDGKYYRTQHMVHNLGGLPAFQMPGKFIKKVGTSVLKKTLLHAMVSHLNKAARESNDLDAGVIKHLHLKEWAINNIPCTVCKGATVVPGLNGPVTCKKCEGTGMANLTSPFGKMIIKPPALGEQSLPTPPMGYVDLNPEILNIANARIEAHLYKALSAINMEHLAETQLNQSGVAKEFDRDEVNTLIYGFAGSMAYILNTCIYWINELRYGGIKTSNGTPFLSIEDRKKLLPVIPVPEKFDVVNTTFLLGEYQIGKTAGLNSIILSELQKEIAQKKFYANPSVAAFVQTIMEIDPFPDKTVEEKALMQGQGLATKSDVIMSNYMTDFVRQAMETDKKFVAKTLMQKREVLKVMADAKVEELNAAAQLAADIFAESNPPTESKPTEPVATIPANQAA